MFDAVDARPDAGANGAVPHRMRGHPHTGPVRLVGDRGELVVGILLGAGRGAVRHHAARRRHLDQLGAVADLVAHTRPHLVDAVGDALRDRQRHDARRQPLEHRRVEVPAVGRDRVAGRIDPGPGMPALVDGALQCDVEQIATRLHHQPEVAHGGESGVECGACVHRAAQRAVRGVVLHAVHGVRQSLRSARPADEQVQLHVHQAGQQRDVAEVDLPWHRIRYGSTGFTAVMRLPSMTTTAGRAHLAGFDVGPARGPQDGDVAEWSLGASLAPYSRHGFRQAVQPRGTGVRHPRLLPALDRERHHDHRVQQMHQVEDVVGHVVEGELVAEGDRLLRARA